MIMGATTMARPMLTPTIMPYANFSWLGGGGGTGGGGGGSVVVVVFTLDVLSDIVP